MQQGKPFGSEEGGSLVVIFNDSGHSSKELRGLPSGVSKISIESIIFSRGVCTHIGWLCSN